MSTVNILQQLPQLFRYADVQKFTGSANIFLTRALKKDMVQRVAKGIYINSFLKGYPKVEEVACFLRSPSYISCEWALNRHGVLLQSPFVCTALTLGTAVGAAHRIQYGGVTIEYQKIVARLFYGYEMRDGFNLAQPEKALLDAVYLRKDVPFRDELELDMLDKDRLAKMAESFPAATRRRLEAFLTYG